MPLISRINLGKFYVISGENNLGTVKDLRKGNWPSLCELQMSLFSC